MRLGKFSGEDKGIEFGEEDGNGRKDGAVDEIEEGLLECPVGFSIG